MRQVRVKEYKTFKTKKKTAKENNLIISPVDDRYLYDFSLLDDLLVSDEEKEIIKRQLLKYTSSVYDVDFYSGDIDNFNTFCGKTLFYNHKVYSVDGRFLYRICQLAKIEHCQGKRKSVYDEYDKTVYQIDSGYSEPSFDIEIV
jgi:hypothetical protein